MAGTVQPPKLVCVEVTLVAFANIKAIKIIPMTHGYYITSDVFTPAA
jgi:hypothetical protein